VEDKAPYMGCSPGLAHCRKDPDFLLGGLALEGLC